MEKRITIQNYDQEMSNLGNQMVDEQQDNSNYNVANDNNQANIDQQIQLDQQQNEIQNRKQTTRKESQLTDLPSNLNLTRNYQPNQLGEHQMLRLNIDSTNKRKMNMIFCILTLLLSIVYITALLVPSALLEIDEIRTKCPNTLLVKQPVYCKQVASKSPQYYGNILTGLTKLNQRLYLSASFLQPPHLLLKQIQFKVPFRYKVTVVYLDEKFQVKEVKSQQEHSVTITCDNTKQYKQHWSRCRQQHIVYLQQLTASNYLILVEVLDYPQLSPYIDNIQYNYSSLNPSFTQMVLGVRYLCIIITLAIGIYYISRLYRLPVGQWVVEQKMIVGLGGCLLLFDDPFVAFTLLYPNLFSAFTSTLWQVLFVASLMFFFLVIFHSMHADQNQKYTKVITPFKIILISVFVVVTVTLFFLMILGFYKDPSLKPTTEHRNTLLLFLMMYIMLVVTYMAQLLIYYIRTCQVYRQMLNRHQIVFIFSSYFALALLLFLFSQSYTIHFFDSSKVMLTICINNIYVWFLMYFYTPSTKGLKEYAQLKVYNHSLLNHNQIYQHLQDQEDEPEEEVIFQRQQ